MIETESAFWDFMEILFEELRCEMFYSKVGRFYKIYPKKLHIFGLFPSDVAQKYWLEGVGGQGSPSSFFCLALRFDTITLYFFYF